MPAYVPLTFAPGEASRLDPSHEHVVLAGVTTNLLERLFIEERRRLKTTPSARSEKGVLKLRLGAMIRAAGRWRAIRATDLERPQAATVGAEPDQEYEARNGFAKEPPDDARRSE